MQFKIKLNICGKLDYILTKRLNKNKLKKVVWRLCKKKKVVWRLCQMNKIYHFFTKYLIEKLTKNWLIKKTTVKTLLNEWNLPLAH